MIALVDCNNFYCSCERLFEPALQGKPVIVLSNNDGCAIARSEEAKALGIEMGAPFHLIKELIRRHKIKVFSSNYTLYGDISARVMDTLKNFTPHMEVYSIDEAFLDLSPCSQNDIEGFAQEIRREIKLTTGIPISIGIAPSKTLAKIANKFARRNNGVLHLSDKSKRESILREVAIGDVWGIGKQNEARLRKLGMEKAWDLMQMTDEWMRTNMHVTGQRLLNELKGIPCIPIDTDIMPKESICTSQSFARLLTEFKDLKTAVAHYASKCALKLRKQNSCAAVVQVFLQTNSFRRKDPQYFNAVPICLPVATNDTQKIIFYAMAALNMIYRPGYNYLKAGVIVSKIVPSQQVQQGLFDDVVEKKNEKKMIESLDAINEKYGRDFVKFAIEGNDDWKMNRAYLSPCYTTRLADIKKVNI